MRSFIMTTSSLLIALFCLWSIPALAQQGPVPGRAIELNYYSDNFTSPGISAAYTHSLKTWRKHKKNRWVDTSIQTGARVSAYTRVNHHVGYQLSPFARLERIGSRGFLSHVEIGAGYLLKRNLNTTYSIEDGAVREIPFAVHHRFVTSLTLGLGYSLKSTLKLPVSVFVRPGFLFEIPNNLNYLLHLQSEIGLRLHF